MAVLSLLLLPLPQVHRLATELVPSYFSLLPPALLSPFWAVLFYLSLIMLGISQCLALFHAVIQGIIAIKPSGLKRCFLFLTLPLLLD